MCSEKKYSKEKIYLRDAGPKTEHLKLLHMNLSSLLPLTPTLSILRQKSKRRETESLHKSPGIAKSNTLSNSNKKIKNFNNKSTRLNSKIKSLKPFWIQQQKQKRIFLLIH